MRPIVIYTQPDQEHKGTATITRLSFLGCLRLDGQHLLLQRVLVHCHGMMTPNSQIGPARFVWPTPAPCFLH